MASRVSDDTPQPMVTDPDNEYPDIQSDLAALPLADLCSQVMWNFNRLRRVSTKEPLHFRRTVQQHQSNFWISEKALRISASNAKQILGLDTGRMKYLRRHIWGLDPVLTEAMKYGMREEDNGRRAYAEMLRAARPDLTVLTCGMWVNPRYPMLSCTPDGLDVSINGIERLLEIKSPFTLEGTDPNNFESTLSPEQLSRFVLRRAPGAGEFEMKATHKWYYQIQMSMDILKLQECDFVVNSNVNGVSKILTVLVKYDDAFCCVSGCRVASTRIFPVQGSLHAAAPSPHILSIS